MRKLSDDELITLVHQIEVQRIYKDLMEFAQETVTRFGLGNIRLIEVWTDGEDCTEQISDIAITFNDGSIWKTYDQEGSREWFENSEVYYLPVPYGFPTTFVPEMEFDVYEVFRE